MPEYSVRLKDIVAIKRQIPDDWSRITMRVKAVSAKHAMAKAEKLISGNKGYRPYLARKAQLVPAKFAERDYWRKVWAKAYNNIPTRVHVAKIEDWVPQEINSTPLPVFIREEAHGRMMRSVDGVIFKRKTTHNAYKMGALNALTNLLQYAKWNKHHSMAHHAVSIAMARGSRPSTPERRKLLIKLAGPNGMAIAAEMLNRQYHNLKIKGVK